MSADKSTKIERVCKNPSCGNRFSVSPWAVRNGGGKYCSRKCYSKGQTRSLLERFLPKVGRKRKDGCILWTGGIDRGGYGLLFTKKENGHRHFIRAHRFSYELTFGPIADGLYCLHKCDNRRCLNPSHLFLGNHVENMTDMKIKGRVVHGEKHHRAKLTESQVRKIRRRYGVGDITQKMLAQEYGVNQRIISLIIRMEAWRHVS